MPVIQHRRLLGEAIRAKRKNERLSQERLAEKADLSTVFIRRVERRKESPYVDSLVKIPEALRARVRDLVREFLARPNKCSPLTLLGRVGMAAWLSLGSVVRRGYRSPTMPRYFDSSTSSSATVAYGCPFCSLKATNLR